MVSSHRGVGEADPAASRGASAAALLPEERRSMPDVNMPKLSDTMEEGTIVEWKKKSGDEVKTGEVLAEVESDKATFDLEAESDGVLQILVEQGVPAKIGAPIAKIGEGGGQAQEAAPTKQASPKKQEPAEPKTEEPETSPTIARRMAEAKSTVPEFQVTVEARVDLAVSLRQQLKDSVPGAEKVTMTDFLVRACALALRKFPEVNSSWADNRFQRKRSINIGLAVAPSQGMGLLVPVVHDADIKDLVQISIESRQVIERARSGRPAEGDLSGATFSISNLGMFGVDEFTAIINPPEAAILAVGAIKDVPVVEDGRIVPGKVMRMTLSVDHRVFYGATAAQFMAEVKRLIENPVALLMPPA